MQTVPKLIEQFIPSAYDLSLEFDREKRIFGGMVIITGQALDEKTITLHSKQLDIKSIEVNRQPADFSFGDCDSLIIQRPSTDAGVQTISIAFGGDITDSMHGVYPCSYEYEGAKKELIATQFESHYAREAFPCIDEPAAKAIFDLTLITETNVTVLGNMPIKSQEESEGKLVTKFDTTPKMSSYLLAWVFGELHSKTAKTKDGVEVNVWATPAQSSASLDFALQIAVKSIEFFNEYFDTPYPLPKCDNVALPDFAAGAMENWGLVTYREIALLVEPNITSIFSRNYVALVIAHELSHQWFGNLVTMKWWNDLWLNESFATMMEYVAIDNIQPDWDVWSDFNDSETIVSLRRDSLRGVQPVQCEVHHPDEISTLFDGAIVYAKGARLMRMLRQYIGDEAFQKGLKQYFKKFAYQNTEDKDLWAALSESSGKDIADLMNKWLSQPGFPVVSVEVSDDKIKLSQSKLTDDSEQAADALWPIPLNSNYPELPDLMTEKTIEIDRKTREPLWLNRDNTAHFITRYDKDLLQQHIKGISDASRGRTDRLQLLNEQSILARAGIISSADLLPLLDAYKNETDEPVWGIINMAISELKKFVDTDTDSEKKLKQYAKSLAQGQFARLGWDIKPDEPESDSKLRLFIAGMMLYSDDEEIVNQAVAIYNSKPFEQLTPEIRGIELSAFIRGCSDETIVKDLLKKYSKTTLADVKLDLCNGLTSVRDSKLIAIVLDSVKDPSIVKPQDVFRWTAYMLSNKYSRQQTWDWMRKNWEWIEKTFASDKSYDDYPRFAAQALLTQQQLEEYKQFFLPLRSIPVLTRNIDMGIVEIQNRVNKMTKDGPAVRAALMNL
jgi:aminopeptidase N